MWIILALLLTTSTFGLSLHEQVRNAKIFKVFEGNILLLDKGLEDGISRNDHVKISHELDGYGSRAICLKSEMEQSYWHLYRIPHEELFSKDFTYIITDIGDHEIPAHKAPVQDWEKRLIEEKIKEEPKDAKVVRDLPEKLHLKDYIKKHKR